MIVHPGSNVSSVLNYQSNPVGGLTMSNFPLPGDAITSLPSANPVISPTLLELNGP